MANPTIFFCVGATKAGTTWLYHYLLEHPQCHMRGVKEIHYFDMLGRGPDHFYHRTRAKTIARLEERLKGVPFWREKDRRRKLADTRELFALDAPGPEGPHDSYLAYLNNGRKDQRLIGDITPCYSTLTRETFAAMRDLATDVRFVYLLRDPIDRAWSQARMNATRHEQAGKPVTAAQMLEDFIEGRNDGFRARSDYAHTLTELTAAVPADRLHVAFYEDLFTPDALRALTDFLGLDYRAADFDQVRHAGRSERLDDTQRRRALNVLRQQYTYCERFFDGLLPDRWRTHMTEA